MHENGKFHAGIGLKDKLTSIGSFTHVNGNRGDSVEVIDLRTLVPLDKETIVNSVKKTGRLLIVDEGYTSFGVAAEICAAIQDDVFYDLDAPIRRLCAPDVPIPFSPALEKFIVPTENTILKAIQGRTRKSFWLATSPPLRRTNTTRACLTRRSRRPEPLAQAEKGRNTFAGYGNSRRGSCPDTSGDTPPRRRSFPAVLAPPPAARRPSPAPA